MVDDNFDAAGAKLTPERSHAPVRVEIVGRARAGEVGPGVTLGPSESTLYCKPENGTFGVFDGSIRGGNDGKIGAEIATNCVAKELGVLPSGVTHGRAADIVYGALKDASKEIADKGKGMGVSAAVGVISRDEFSGALTATIGYVGNCEVRLLRDGVLSHLTLGDTSVREMRGRYQDEKMTLQAKLANAATEKELDIYEQSHYTAGRAVTEALGKRGIEPHIEHHQLKPSDRLVVINYGISHNLTTREIQDILNRNPDTQDAMMALVEAAIRRSHGKDGSFRAKYADMAGIVVNVPPEADKQVNATDPLTQVNRGPLVRPSQEPGSKGSEMASSVGYRNGDLLTIDGLQFRVVGTDSKGRIDMRPVVQGQGVVSKAMSPDELKVRGIVPIRSQERQQEAPQRSPRVFHTRERVTVLRHSGKFEKDWTLMQPNYEAGTVRAIKYDGNGNALAHRDFRLSEIAEWNK